MWKKISRKKLDEIQYQRCLHGAINYKVYAEIWYLDSLTEKKWYCYVWKDYEAIMPICFDKKLLMTRIIQPAFCQQLGIFYKEGITQEIFQEGYQLVKKSYVKSYAFNDQNSLKFEFKGKSRKNYLLKLKSNLEGLSNEFNNNTKRNIKKGNNANLRCEISKDFHSLLGLKRNEKPYLIDYFTRLAQRAIEEKKGEVWEAFDVNNQMVAAFFLIESENYLLYLMAGSTEEGKNLNAMSFLINQLLIKYSESQKILDFEGSQSRSVGRFYKGFGSKNIEYKVI